MGVFLLSDDARWYPWIGCWQRSGDAGTSTQFTCVRPSGDGSADITHRYQQAVGDAFAAQFLQFGADVEWGFLPEKTRQLLVKATVERREVLVHYLRAAHVHSGVESGERRESFERPSVADCMESENVKMVG